MTPVEQPLVVITGATGLIGTLVARDLVVDHRVVGLDIATPKTPIEGMDFIQCDLTSDEDVQRVMREVREKHGRRLASIVHLAAYYDFSGEPNPLYDQLTVQGTRRLLRGAQEFETEQFIFSSSLLVMKPPETPDTLLMEDSPVRAEWAYPQSKLDAEAVLREEHGQIPVVVLRIAGVYDEDGNSLPIGQHIRRIHEKQLESYMFPGHPEAGQAYVHLDDLTACFRATVESRQRLEPYEVFLIAEPDVMSHQELQEKLGVLLHGHEWPTIRIPKAMAKTGTWLKGKLGEEQWIKPWMVDLADDPYPVDVSRARTRLNWHPRHRLRETLPEIIRRLKADPPAWYQKNKLPPPGEYQPSEAEKRLRALLAADVRAKPQPWDYNPSAWRQRIAIALLAAVAFVPAVYMGLYQWRLIGDVWDPIFGDQSKQVLDSDLSHTMSSWMHVPDAILGALAYLGDIIFALAGSQRRWQYRPWIVMIFGLDVIPLGIVSALLIFAQGTVVGAWCFLCLVTAVISLLLVYLAYDEVWSSLKYLHGAWKRAVTFGAWWDVFIGRPSQMAVEVGDTIVRRQ